MSEQLKEWLPNPTFVDYQVPHDGQGADFYDEHKMLEYGKRIVMKCAKIAEDFDDTWTGQGTVSAQIMKEYFGVEE